ncbi:hypothetical protein AFULGI_00016160 [Archaeoglobus fulgidus DSM 8774]|uniref:Uncharacterized protein n=2 Tax=Archaeoglobus fulgidus TaxID=2234 RepID=A0A075WLC8_ARCFL|nr:hypothetical protein AFULGI_00016160 [Archaeoglobus fulgidus DSM 8774]
MPINLFNLLLYLKVMKLNVIVWKEEDMFIVREVFTGVTTQGKTIEEALENIKEAVELYLEELPELKEELEKKEIIGVMNV